MIQAHNWEDDVQYHLIVECPYADCGASIDGDVEVSCTEHYNEQIIRCPYCQREFELGEEN